MGLPFPQEPAPVKITSKNQRDMQRYYSQTFREYVQTNQNVSFSSRTTIAQIFTKTRESTPTFSNRDLALLDIDKIISFNTGSLSKKGDRVKNMQMVAQLMQEQLRRQQTNREVVAVLDLLSRQNENSALELLRGQSQELQNPTNDMLTLQ